MDDCPLGFTEKKIIPMRVKAGEGLFCTIIIETFLNHSGVVTPSLVRLSHLFVLLHIKQVNSLREKGT